MNLIQEVFITKLVVDLVYLQFTINSCLLLISRLKMISKRNKPKVALRLVGCLLDSWLDCLISLVDVN